MSENHPQTLYCQKLKTPLDQIQCQLNPSCRELHITAGAPYCSHQRTLSIIIIFREGAVRMSFIMHSNKVGDNTLLY